MAVHGLVTCSSDLFAQGGSATIQTYITSFGNSGGQLPIGPIRVEAGGAAMVSFPDFLLTAR